MDKLTADLAKEKVERRISLGTDWAFLDCVTATNSFRIDPSKVMGPSFSVI